MSERQKVPDPEFGRLLGGKNAPSVLEKEAVLDAVMAEVEPRRRRSRLWSFMSVASAVAAVFIAFIVWPGPDEFTPRGDQKVNVFARCSPEPCRAGGKLVLDVRTTDAHPYFGAFSHRSDGVAVWYAPEGAKKTAEVKHLGFAIDEKHPPGDYVLYGLFTDEPLDREALKIALGEALEPTESVRIVKRTFAVRP